MFQFLLVEPIHEAGLRVLQEAGQVRLASDPSEATLLREVGDCDGLIIRSRGRVTRNLLAHAPRLRVVGRHGVGVDNVDLAAATEFGVQVVNTPQAVVESVAEHTVGLMLALSKKIVYLHERLRQGDFEARYRVSGHELRGRTVGIIGFGNIGRRVGEICRLAFEMQLLYCDMRRAPELERTLGARQVPLDALLAQSDYVTVHVPLLPETYHLIGAREFALMRPDAFFFNLARGEVVDEAALYAALREGHIAGAGIDVFAQEPTPADNPLLKLDNIVFTPHAATTTEESLRDMSLVALDVVRVLRGEPPAYPVNRLGG